MRLAAHRAIDGGGQHLLRSFAFLHAVGALGGGGPLHAGDVDLRGLGVRRVVDVPDARAGGPADFVVAHGVVDPAVALLGVRGLSNWERVRGDDTGAAGGHGLTPYAAPAMPAGSGVGEGL